MTNGWVDIKNADVVLAMGGNPAENHPCGFKWTIEARKTRGAKLVVVDPRFTRTGAVADLYSPIRSGTDVAYLLGIIRYAIANKRYHEEYVKLFTNAGYLISDKYGFDEGIFTGFDEKAATYDKTAWGYEANPKSKAYGVDPTLEDPLRLPAAEEARRPLHTGRAREDHRHAEGDLPQSAKSSHRPTRPSGWARSAAPWLTQHSTGVR